MALVVITSWESVVLFWYLSISLRGDGEITLIRCRSIIGALSNKHHCNLVVLAIIPNTYRLLPRLQIKNVCCSICSNMFLLIIPISSILRTSLSLQSLSNFNTWSPDRPSFNPAKWRSVEAHGTNFLAAMLVLAVTAFSF